MTTLEDVLEEISPTPDPDFVADMERRMRLGFPAKRKRRLPVFRPQQVTLAAASALLALLVVVSVTGGGDQPTTATTDSVVAEDFGDAAARMAAPEASGATSLAQPIPPPGGGGDFAPGADARRIERSAQLTLASDPDDFDGVADAIFRTADRHDGFVLSSSFTQG